MTTEIGEGVIGLGISEAELEVRNTRKAPGGPVVSRELGRDPKLENLRLGLKLFVVFTTVDSGEARDVYLPAIIVLLDALGKKAASLLDLKNLIGGLDLSLLLVP